PAPFHLWLQQGAKAPIELDTAHLWPQPLDMGLAFTATGPSADVRRIDPFVGAYAAGPASFFARGSLPEPRAAQLFTALPLARPGNASGLMRWSGELYAEGGQYRMELRTDSLAQLDIDESV